jgi:hypothetical protein
VESPKPPLGPYRAGPGRPPRSSSLRARFDGPVVAACVVFGLAIARLLAFALGRDRPSIDAPLGAAFAIAAAWVIVDGLGARDYGRGPP